MIYHFIDIHSDLELKQKKIQHVRQSVGTKQTHVLDDLKVTTFHEVYYVKSQFFLWQVVTAKI